MPASRLPRRDINPPRGAKLSRNGKASRDVEPPRPVRRWPLVFWGLLGLVVVLSAGVFVLPASMITYFLPAQVRAEDFSGSLLHGAAGKLRVNEHKAGAIEWRLHPLSLLRLALVADIHWVKVGFLLDGTAELSSRGVTAHDIKGGGPIEDLRDLGLAAGWRGTANVAFAEISSDYQKLDSALGKLDVRDLAVADIADGSDLGSYELQLAAGAIAPDGSITANLKDIGGPVEAQAQIQFSPATRTGMLSGTLKERPEASPALRNQLSSIAQLRPRDASGRFPVELEFTL